MGTSLFVFDITIRANGQLGQTMSMFPRQLQM